MALKTIRIPEELMEKLEARDPADPLQALIALAERFIDVEPADRTLFVPAAPRAVLEKVYGKPIDQTNVDRFAAAVLRTAQLCIGETSYLPTQGQMKAIEHEARAQGVSIAKFLERELPEMIAGRWGY